MLSHAKQCCTVGYSKTRRDKSNIRNALAQLLGENTVFIDRLLSTAQAGHDLSCSVQGQSSPSASDDGLWRTSTGRMCTSTPSSAGSAACTDWKRNMTPSSESTQGLWRRNWWMSRTQAGMCMRMCSRLRCVVCSSVRSLGKQAACPQKPRFGYAHGAPRLHLLGVYLSKKLSNYK